MRKIRFFYPRVKSQIIRIYHECEGRIEKSVPRIVVWHHEACRMMTNGDPEGRIFFYPTLTRIMELIFCSPLFLFIFLFDYLFILKYALEVLEYAKMQCNMVTLLDVLGKIAWVR